MLNGDVTFSQYCAVYDVQFTTYHVSLNLLLSLCFSVSILAIKLERDKETVHRIYCPVPTPRYTVKERRNKAGIEWKKRRSWSIKAGLNKCPCMCVKALKFTVFGSGKFRPRHVFFTIVASPFELLRLYTLCNIKSSPFPSMISSTGLNNTLRLCSYSFSNTWPLQNMYNTLLVHLPAHGFVLLKADGTWSILNCPYNYWKLIEIRIMRTLFTH